MLHEGDIVAILSKECQEEQGKDAGGNHREFTFSYINAPEPLDNSCFFEMVLEEDTFCRVVISHYAYMGELADGTYIYTGLRVLARGPERGTYAL